MADIPFSDPRPAPPKVEPFGQLPNWPFEKGVWSAMTSAERSVYGVLVHLTRNKSGSVEAGWVEGRTVQEISRLCGVAVRSISMVTRSLVNWGLIQKRGRRNWCAYRVLRTPPRDISERVKFLSRQYPSYTDTHRQSRIMGKFDKREAEMEMVPVSELHGHSVSVQLGVV